MLHLLGIYSELRPGKSKFWKYIEVKMCLYILVPVNYLPEKDGHQRFFKERISYEHQYDSRFDKNYPIRSAVSADIS